MEEVFLGDNEIETLINGGSIKVALSEGKTVLIKQSYSKDIAAPMINHDKKIYSKSEIENIKKVSGLISNSMKLGV